MPKLKTKKGTAKRFKLTKSGKIKFYSGGKSHLATSKQPEKLRKLRKARVFKSGKELAAIKRLLPYA
ncbi:MAG: 50S ribosomal protein L35 [Candidatus Omnitrophica bacterium]|nr:50S ribosomal protein L35 [Candidatus Omnitrophota bacterium]